MFPASFLTLLINIKYPLAKTLMNFNMPSVRLASMYAMYADCMLKIIICSRANLPIC